MRHDEFAIGSVFYTRHVETRHAKWRCTDIGTRTVLAIRLDHVEMTRVSAATGERSVRVLDEAQAEAENLFAGPPFGCVEHVFDEYEIEACSPEIPVAHEEGDRDFLNAHYPKDVTG